MLSDRPILVVGSPRSGTSLVRSMLNAHPHIFCPDWETGVFLALDKVLNGDFRTIHQVLPNMPLHRPDLVDWARACVLDLMRRFAEKCGKQRWAEKTPGHVRCIKTIHEVFPGAHFLHVIRNGYEVVRSLQNMVWAPRKIRWSTRAWVESVRAGREAGGELAPDLYREVRYEELTARPEEVLRDVCRFLGEPFVPELLEFHKPEKNTWGSDSPALQKKSLGRYKELGWIERLVFNRLAGPLMQELGYSR